MNKKLIWFSLDPDGAQMGFHTQPPMVYTESYFKAYQHRDRTDMGVQLTNARCDLVRRWYDKTVVDIGIGGGAFVQASDGLGFDVCQDAVDWLKDTGRFWDFPKYGAEAVTCWDSLEHIPDIVQFLEKVSKHVFLSMPIYKDKQDCLSSKHYKPGEHLWYFTHKGLIHFMRWAGFDMVEYTDIESEIGRESIRSYAFTRFTYGK